MHRNHDVPAVVIGGLTLLRSFLGTGLPVLSVPPSPTDLVRHSRLFRPSGVTIADLREGGDAVFLQKLIALASRTGSRPVLLYGDDEVLSFVARNRDALQRHFRLALPCQETLSGCLSKAAFARLTASAGLPVPRTIVSRPDLDSTEIGRTVGFPCVLKPDSHVGWHSRSERPAGGYLPQKVLIAGDPAAAEEALRAMRAFTDEFVVQAYVAGAETEIYSYHGYVPADDPTPVRFVGRKIRTYPSSCGESTYLELVNNEAVMALGDEVVRRLDIRGPLKIDFKLAPDGSHLYILEINLRFSLWNYLGARCGVNLPLLAYGDAIGTPPARCSGSYDTGVTWLRFGADARAVLRDYLPTGQISIGSWLRSLMRSKVCAVFAWKDPLPFFVHTLHALPRSAHRIFRRAVS